MRRWAAFTFAIGLGASPPLLLLAQGCSWQSSGASPDEAETGAIDGTVDGTANDATDGGPDARTSQDGSSETEAAEDAAESGPAATVLAVAHDPSSLRLDEGYAWFFEAPYGDAGPASRATVWRVPKDGGTQEAVVRIAEQALPAIVVDSTSFYVRQMSPTVLNRVLTKQYPKDGGAPQIVATESLVGLPLRLGTWLEGDDQNLYVDDSLSVGLQLIGGHVIAKGGDGGTPSIIPFHAGLAYKPYQGWVYATRSDWTVVRNQAGPATDETIADSQIGVDGLYVDDSGVYWTSLSYGAIVRASPPAVTDAGAEAGQAGPDGGADPDADAGEGGAGGAGVTVLAYQVGTEPRAITGDATSLYWAEGIGRIRKVAKSGGPATVVVADAGSPTEIAVDDCCLYWLDRTAGTLQQAPK